MRLCRFGGKTQQFADISWVEIRSRFLVWFLWKLYPKYEQNKAYRSICIHCCGSSLCHQYLWPQSEIFLWRSTHLKFVRGALLRSLLYAWLVNGLYLAHTISASSFHWLSDRTLSGKTPSHWSSTTQLRERGYLCYWLHSVLPPSSACKGSEVHFGSTRHLTGHLKRVVESLWDGVLSQNLRAADPL